MEKKQKEDQLLLLNSEIQRLNFKLNLQSEDVKKIKILKIQID